MSANLIIIQLLHTKTNHVDFLRMTWENLSVQQKREIFYFLYNSGQYKTFLTVLRTELNQENPFVPWTHLFSIFAKIKKLSPDVAKSFSHANPIEEQARFRVDDELLSQLWRDRKENTFTSYLGRKKTLIESLKFAKLQGAKDQRSKVLAELKKLFPNDKEVGQVFHEEKEFQARQTLHRISSKRYQPSQINFQSEKFDKTMIASIKKTALQAIKKNKNMILNIAVMLFQMELFAESLKVLDTIKRKPSQLLWYELYICIEAKQFARALTVISLLKRKKNIDSNKSFSLLYFQALALHGLGKMQEAKQIIHHIVKIRPHFKSATSLLLEWENDK